MKSRRLSLHIWLLEMGLRGFLEAFADWVVFTDVSGFLSLNANCVCFVVPTLGKARRRREILFLYPPTHIDIQGTVFPGLLGP